MIPKVISTMEAPSAIGVYSQAVRAGDLIYISGQIGLDPDTMQMVSDSVKEQVEQVMKNIQSIASAAGADLASIVKMTVYYTQSAIAKKLRTSIKTLLSRTHHSLTVLQLVRKPRNRRQGSNAIAHVLIFPSRHNG